MKIPLGKKILNVQLNISREPNWKKFEKQFSNYFFEQKIGVKENFFDVTDEEFEYAMYASGTLLKIKAKKLEDFINQTENVRLAHKKFSEYKKLTKSLKTIYKEYGDMKNGLGDLATNFLEIDSKVNALIEKYKDIKFYSEVFNGEGKR